MRTIVVVRSVVVILGGPGLLPARRFPSPSLAIRGGLALALACDVKTDPSVENRSPTLVGNRPVVGRAIIAPQKRATNRGSMNTMARLRENKTITIMSAVADR